MRAVQIASAIAQPSWITLTDARACATGRPVRGSRVCETLTPASS